MILVSPEKNILKWAFEYKPLSKVICPWNFRECHSVGEKEIFKRSEWKSSSGCTGYCGQQEQYAGLLMYQLHIIDEDLSPELILTYTLSSSLPPSLSLSHTHTHKHKHSNMSLAYYALRGPLKSNMKALWQRILNF